MKVKNLLKSFTTPEPPRELRSKILSGTSIRWDLEINSRTVERTTGLRILWSIGVASCLIFLFVWDPPFPGPQTPNSASVPMDQDEREISLHGFTFENDKKSASFRSTEIMALLKAERL